MGKRQPTTTGLTAWLIIIGFAAWHELFCEEDELLSRVVYRGNKRHPILFRLILLALLLHLNQWYPKKLQWLDPFSGIAVLNKNLAILNRAS